MNTPGPLELVAADSAARMRAAVVAAPGRVEITSIPVPEPSAGEVRLRVECCGVCSSNLSPWAGQPWFNYPLEPGALGHEGVGWVDALGPDVTGWERGQRVTFLSNHAYAEFDIAKSGEIVSLPSVLDYQPFLGEPLGCAMNIFCRSNIRAGDTVAVVGIGFLGSLLVQLAASAGARVLAVVRRPCARDMARSLGAAEVIPYQDHGEVIQSIRQLTGGKLCEVTIEAAGKQQPLDLAGELTGERGRLVIAGYHQDGPRQVNLQLWNWRGLDVINAHERDASVYIRGIHCAIDAVCEGRLRFASLLTHQFPLEELGRALDLARDRPDGFFKALITL